MNAFHVFLPFVVVETKIHFSFKCKVMVVVCVALFVECEETTQVFPILDFLTNSESCNHDSSGLGFSLSK